tara:strand:+ start:182 stop:370 length:189 start_codon:yes stop_codon:yes gene_type:complete
MGSGVVWHVDARVVYAMRDKSASGPRATNRLGAILKILIIVIIKPKEKMESIGVVRHVFKAV